jgi:MFS family permease
MNISKNVIPIILLTFVNSMNLSILTPTLPFVVEQLGQNELVFGALLTAYSIFQFIGAPFLGTLSDRFGRKPILLITQGGTFLSWVLFAISYYFFHEYASIPLLTVWILGVARVVDGLTGGNSSVGAAYVADVTDPEDKLKNFGLLEVAMGVGLFFGLAIGSFTGSETFGYLPTALIAVAISLVTWVMLYLYLDESLPPEKRGKYDTNFWDEINAVKKLRKYKEDTFVYEMYWNRGIISFSMSFFISIIILHIIQLFGFNKTEVGYILLAVGIVMIINQTALLKVFVDRLGNFWTLLIAQLLISVGLFGMSLTASVVWYFVAYFFANLGFSLSLPTTKTMISNNVPEDEQGEALGLDLSVYAMATAFTPMIATAIYFFFKETFGNPSYTFALLAVMPLIGFVSLARLSRGYDKNKLREKSI